MGKKDFNYFDAFASMADTAVDVAKLMRTALDDLSTIEQAGQQVHKLENQADSVFHDIVTALHKAFITPIERDDIKQLAGSIDDVIDAIDALTKDFYLYNVKTAYPEAIEFADLIIEGCEAMRGAAQQFVNYKKPSELHKHIVAMNDIEDRGDVIYARAIHRLFRSETDAVEVLKWRRIFEVMERCCDEVENVADVMDGVILKNT